ncbi:MAG: pentapeptide repeat-containing protein, partial [Thermoguttaceae bacterium]|nr:pentapeptide repeat-containing protein [Thermoguttaceae bacterium]
YLPEPFHRDILSFRGFDFSNSILVDVLFKRVDLTAASFENAALKNADFTECVGLTLEQMESTWNWKAGRMDLIKLPPELQAQVDAALAQDAAQAPETEASPETEPAPETK